MKFFKIADFAIDVQAGEPPNGTDKMVRPLTQIIATTLLLTATQGYAVSLRSPGIPPQVLQERLAASDAPLVIDVRSPDEFSSGHVPGSMNLPAPTVTKHLDQIRQAREVVLYCNDTRFTAVAERLLHNAKLKEFSHLEGGLTAWRQNGLPVEMSLPE